MFLFYKDKYFCMNALIFRNTNVFYFVVIEVHMKSKLMIGYEINIFTMRLCVCLFVFP